MSRMKQFDTWWCSLSTTARIFFMILGFFFLMLISSAVSDWRNPEPAAVVAPVNHFNKVPQNPTSSKKIIDEVEWARAAYTGKDSKGKTKEEYILELKPFSEIMIINARIVGKDTSSSGVWYLYLGNHLFTSVQCSQATDEARNLLVRLEEKSIVNLEATYLSTLSNRLSLSECKISKN